MDCIILAGGFGTRLKNSIGDNPKPLAPVSGRPFLDWLLADLVRQGISRFILSVGYRAERIRDYFGNEYSGVPIIYEEEDSPLGTGGAIRQSLRRCVSDAALVVNGDTFCEFQLTDLQKLWARFRSPIMVAQYMSDSSRYGRLCLAGAHIVGFKEKGKSGPGYVNAGNYLIPVGFLNRFPVGHPFSFENDFLVPAIARLGMYAYCVDGRFIDIGIPEDLAIAQELIPYIATNTNFPDGKK